MKTIIQIEEIREKAKNLRTYASGGPEDICRALDISLHYMDLHKKIKAYYFCQSRIHNIVVDSNTVDVFRQVLIAHELGHYSLHRKTAMMKGFEELEVLEKRDSRPMETEANLFAAELLISDEGVLSLLREHTFFETAAILNVPAALLDFKFAVLQKCCRIGAASPFTASPVFLKGLPEAYDRSKYGDD